MAIRNGYSDQLIYRRVYIDMSDILGEIVYKHLRRSHFWGFSYGDTAIFPKLGRKYCFCNF